VAVAVAVIVRGFFWGIGRKSEVDAGCWLLVADCPLLVATSMGMGISYLTRSHVDGMQGGSLLAGWEVDFTKDCLTPVD